MRSTELPRWQDLERIHTSAAEVLRQAPRRARELTHCSICGVPLATHPRCRACTILVGPGHTYTRLWLGMCAGCLKLAARGLLGRTQ